MSLIQTESKTTGDTNSNYKQYLENNKELTLLRGKIAFRKEWPTKLPTEEEIKQHGGNFGWVLGEDDLVVDVDPRADGLKGYEALLVFLRRVDPSINLEPTVNTASDSGFHIYLKMPESERGNKFISKNYKLFPGVDFLTNVGYCVAAGSKTEKGEYTWANDGFKQTPAPPTLLSIIRVPKVDGAAEPVQEAIPNGDTEAAETKPKTTDKKTYDKMPVATVMAYLNVLSADMDQNSWVRIGWALHSWDSTSTGLAIWENWSKGAITKVYKSGDTAKRWAKFNAAGGVTIGSLKAMAELANPNEDVDGEGEGKLINGKPWVEDWTYVRATKQYCSRSLREETDVMGFKDSCDWRVPRGGKKNTPLAPNARDWVMKNNLIKTVHSKSYMPALPTTIFSKGGRDYVNTFYPETVPAAAEVNTPEGDAYWDALLDHYKLIFVDPKDVKLALEWTAFQVQHQGEKLLWAPVIQGPRRCGKSYFKYLLELLLGDDHVAMVNPSELGEGFNEWAVGNSVVAIEEFGVKGKDKHNVTQKLKSLITEPTVMVNNKFGSKGVEFNVTNYIGLTNDKAGIPPEDIDGRFWVIFTPFYKADKMSFYEHLNKNGFHFDAEPAEWKGLYFKRLMQPVTSKDKTIGAQLRKRFIEYKISQEFLDMTEAPSTIYGEAVSDSAQAGVAGFNQLKDLINEGGLGYSKNMLSFDDVWSAFDKLHGDKMVSHNERGFLLEKIGMLVKLIRVDGRQIRVWVPSKDIKQSVAEASDTYKQVFDTDSQKKSGGFRKGFEKVTNIN